MRKDDLKYMPKTRALLGNKGMRFEKAFVSMAWCCPSRATIMRGQHAHNHGVWFTKDTADGGWQGYKNLGNERRRAVVGGKVGHKGPGVSGLGPLLDL